MDPPAGQAWTAGQVARHLGISESTLRTWHRRYGLSPSGGQPGHYRRYQAEDVLRLTRMAELTRAGVLASEAARIVAGGTPAAIPVARDRAELTAAAQRLDTARCGLLLDALLARRGVVSTWELVCRPALRAVDARRGGDPVQVAVEHGLSWAVLGALHRLPRPAPASGAPLVLLACADREQHTLPLAVLGAALAERRGPSRMLGASVPAVTLARAVRETRPGAVVVWSQQPGTAAPETLDALRRYPVHRVAAGPGWTERRLAGTELVTTLESALAALETRGPA